MKTRATTILVVLSMLATIVLVSPPTAEARVETFVDGTELELAITSPADGAATNGGQIDVTGTARIGAGTAPGTSLVVAYDLSSSTIILPNDGDCGGDLDSDGTPDTILDCEIAAVIALEQTAIELGSVAEMGVVGFERLGGIADVQPGPGRQALTVPGADLNNNGQTDISEVVRSTEVSGNFVFNARRRINLFTRVETFAGRGGEDFEQGLRASCDVLSQASQPNRVIVFISDGFPTTSGRVDAALPCATPTTVYTVAVGSGSSCARDPLDIGSLQDAADLGGGECFEIVNAEELPDFLGSIIAPEITQLTLTVNGGAEVDISSASQTPLPARGPISIDWATTVTDLVGSDDEICVTAYGENNRELLTSTECVTVGGNNPPVAGAGDDQVVAEGSLVTLDGLASVDPDGDPLSYAWELTSSTGQPPVISASTEPALSFLAFDDATYEFTLTVSDGRSTSTDTVSVVVENAAPVATGLAEPAAEGGVALVTASFTDAGLLDTHTATVDWGDGLSDDVAITAQGNGWGSLYASHSYDAPGAYTATITIIDDDGAAVTVESVGVEVAESVAVWSGGSDFGIEWSGSDNVVSGLLHSNDFLKMNGSNSIVGSVEYVTGLDDSGEQPFDQQPQQVNPSPYPINFDLADYQPGGRAAIDAGANYFDMSNECGDKWDAKGDLAAGLYYVPCEVVFSDSDLEGEITIVATGPIEVSGSEENFRPYIDGLLFFSADDTDKALKVAGSDNLFLGYMFAPDGWIELSGSTNTYTCGVLGAEMKVSGSSSTFRASDCVRPERTVAPPALIPNLETTIAVTPDEVLPGSEITTTASVTNTGSLLLVPGIVGLENFGDTAVTVTDVTLGLEYLPAAGGGWTSISEPITISSTPNADPNVLYADTGFAGTVVQPEGLATWGAELQVELPPATVDFLLDPAQVLAVRNTFSVTVDDPSVPVRNLFRFGNDFAEELRALSGDVTDATVYVSAPDGTTQIVDAATDPALAVLTPGATASIDTITTVAVPEARGADEPVQGYLDRLSALDDTQLNASAYAFGNGGIGPVLGAFQFDQTTRRLPVVSAELAGAPALVAGDTSNFELTFQNLGSATAASVDASATVDADAATVTGTPAELVPGAIETATFDVAIDPDAPQGFVDVDSLTSWTDANGNVYGVINADTVVEVASAPELLALMADVLAVDADDSGVPSTGDTIGYNVTIVNRGATPADDVIFDVTPDGSLVAGSTTTSQGTVIGDVSVDVGSIQAMGSVEIYFEVIAGASDLSSQGVVTSSDTDPVLTDDPSFLGVADPTVTTLIASDAELVVAMGVRLGVDPADNGNTVDDTFEYELRVTNTGLIAANLVEVVVPIDPNTTLVPGSVEVSDGEIITGNTEGDTDVVVNVSAIPSFGFAMITFDVTVNDGLPEGEIVVSAQATTTFADDQTGVLSDDPDLPGTEDPTEFTVSTTIIPGDSGGDTDDPAGDAGPGNTWGDDAGFGDVTPTSNQIVSAPIAVTAAITPPPDTVVETWSVTAFPSGGDPATGLVLAEGTVEAEAEPPALLATFDPTVLSNGVWTIRIEATDDANGMGVHEVNVVVDGQLKLGRFSATWVDSSVAVSGIPVEILRTYDTVERFGFDDYGYGWTLDVANFEVATNRPLYESAYSVESCGGGAIFSGICYTPDTQRIVNVTWPDGRVDSFELRATGNTFVTGLAIIEYAALPGTNSKLFPAPGTESAGVNAFGELTEGLFFPNSQYNPQQFVLEALDGTRYVVDINEGLIEATDLNGNTVTFGDDGIISSQGQSLTFTRDEEGRITTVTEPDGSTVSYGYDIAGDLTTVVDQNGVTASFTYDAGHYLTNIDDVIAPFQAMGYDADGRLSSISDSSGNTTSVSVDLDARTTLVTSPSGALTTLETSDERGNIIRSEQVYDGTTATITMTYNDDDLPTSFTDAVGGTRTFDYDADQNLISTTDANGTTESYSYDANGRPISHTDRLGGTSTFAWNDLGNLLTATDGEGRTESYGYDALGNQISRTDGSGGTWSRSVDGAGRTTSITDPNGSTTSMSLDANGRMIGRTSPDGGSESFVYDAEGNLTSWSDQLGRITTFAYDSADQLVQRTGPGGGLSSWSYDPNGRIAAQTDPTGATWSYTWSFDRLVTRVAPDGGTSTYSYDGTGRVVSETDEIGRTTTYGYDAAGRVTSVTTPVGTTQLTYDANGFLVSQSNENGELTTYGVNPAGQVTSMTDPLGRSTSSVYDLVGQQVAMSDTLGNSWSWSYDGAGRVTSQTVADGGTYNYAFDSAGNMTSSTDPLGRVTSYSYDSMNRQISMAQPGDGTATWTWDAAGQLTSTTSAAGYQSSFEYDSRGFRIQSSDGIGNTTFSTHDAVGRLTSLTDPNGGAYGYTYDPVGRLTSETDPLGGSVSFSYDAAGQRTSFTNPNGGSRSWTYDGGGRVTSHSDELGRITSYSYDPAGRQLSMTDPRGVTVNRSFDAAGQLTQESAGTETRSFSYDAGGRVTSFSDATGTTSLGWDPMGRLTSATSAAGVVSYSYNLAGERVSMTQPEGTTSYNWDSNSNLAGLTDWRSDSASFTNDADGRTLSVTRSNGVGSSYGYDGAGRLTSIGHNGPDGLIDSFSYTLDNNGNRIGVVSTASTETYTLDALNRITTAAYGDGTTEAFVYDPAGNRTSHTKVDGTIVNYSHDLAGQITSDSTGVDYTYDGAGNLTGTSAGDSYQYDAWGNLTEATVGGVTTTATFDATNTRVSVDGVSQLWDRTGNGTLVSTGAGDSYVHNPAGGILRENGTWLHSDAVGSVRYATDATSTVIGSATYSAFGETRSATAGTFGFAGEQTDPNSLIHLRARSYNPALGSFTSYDPVQPGGPSTAGWNHFTYSANNPTTWGDPTGESVFLGYAVRLQNALTTVRPVAALAGLGIGGFIAYFSCGGAKAVSRDLAPSAVEIAGCIFVSSLCTSASFLLGTASQPLASVAAGPILGAVCPVVAGAVVGEIGPGALISVIGGVEMGAFYAGYLALLASQADPTNRENLMWTGVVVSAALTIGLGVASIATDVAAG